MVIEEIKYFPKELTFNTPFQSSQKSYSKKKILIVEFKDELNNTAFGECAPLPEFGTETIEQAAEKISDLISNPAQFSFGHGIVLESQTKTSGMEQFEKLFLELSNFPSLRFACEQALFTLISKREKTFFQNLYNTTHKKLININGIVGLGDVNNILDNITSLLKYGFKTIKLKCGRDNFADDFKVLEKIRNHFGENINIRIDVNGKWIWEAAKHNLKELEIFNPEFVEQPVNSNEQLIELSKFTNVKIAADESVKSFESANYLLENGIKFLVIKPTVAGGILNTIKIIKAAEKHNANIIISSSFESNIGKSVLVYLASLTKHNYAHGLGIDNLFKNNICDDVYTINNGTINFDINNYPRDFNI